MYRVMLADDEPIMRKALQTLTDWESMGCEVVYTAVNGVDVQDHLEECRPDILVTDIQMPGKNGIELAKYIWENKLSVKVIILTAYADFSYAQSAVKYDVVDYVTKTGAFDGLEHAVKKCQERIEGERRQQDPEAQKAKEENFFKGVFDGSLCDAQEMEQRSRALNLKLDAYQVLLFQFLMESGVDQMRSRKIHSSLSNFFHMVFGENMLQGVFLQRDIFCVVLRWEDEADQHTVRMQCEKAADMMDNFMELYVYVGISRRHGGIGCLRAAYEEAETALQYSMAENHDKLNFYTRDLMGEELKPESSGSKRQLVQACEQYILEHYEAAITVSDIARAIGTSSSYLSRIFKELTGSTVIQTVNQKKLERARDYLENTDMKVYEVADALGFENITYFSRFFKKHTGTAPKEYSVLKGREEKRP